VGLYLSEDRAAFHGEHRVGAELFRSTHRNGGTAGSVDNAVANVDQARIFTDFVAVDLNGPDDAVLDANTVGASSSSRLGSEGREGSQLQSRPQPGTSVE